MAPGKGDGPTDVADSSRIARVVEKYPIQLGVLFGSQLHGTATAQSDIDVAVAFEGEMPASRRLEKRIELTTDLMTTLGTDAVDVTDLDAVTPAVGRDAMETGQLLVGNRSTLEEYRKRFERQHTAGTETHDDRMEQFDSIIERLDAIV